MEIQSLVSHHPKPFLPPPPSWLLFLFPNKPLTSQPHLNPRSKPHPDPRILLHHRSKPSSIVDPSPTHIPESSSAVDPNPTQISEPTSSVRSPRRRPAPPKLEDTICHMIATRKWTTRLQNSIRSLVPNFDYSRVYNVLHGARSSDQALQFFRWVEKTGFRHDRTTHHKIIEILGHASKLNHARWILLDMPKRGVDWDEELFLSLFDSYGKAGIVQESVIIFQKMKQLGVERTIRSYDTLFKVLLRRGRYMVFTSMLRQGVSPTCHTYNILIWGFFLSLRIEIVYRFFVDMKKRGIDANDVTYNTLINGCCRIKKMEDANKFFLEMMERNLVPNVITYTTKIKGYVSVGQVDEALRWLGEMDLGGIKPNDLTYSTLLPGLCDAEKMFDARKVFNEMVKRHHTPMDNSIFSRLMSCMCKQGDLDGAVEVLNGMLWLSVPMRPSHYGILIENFCKKGMHERVIKMLDKVLEKGFLMSPLISLEVEMGAPQSLLEMKATAYNPMIEYLCNSGQTKKAEVFLRQLMKKGVQDPVVFNNLICGYSKEVIPESAMELLQIMKRRGIALDADAYASLIKSFVKKGEPADAKAALDGMIECGHLPSPLLFRLVMEALFDDEFRQQVG